MMEFIYENWKELTAFSVILVMFVRLLNFLLKDLKGQLKENSEIIRQDSENTKKLTQVISNDWAHALERNTEMTKKDAEGSDRVERAMNNLVVKISEFIEKK